MEMRTEKDSLGPIQVPADALYGAQTRRAVENFPISGRPLPREVIHALALIKQHYALEHGTLEPENRCWNAIAQAAAETAEGRWDSHFPVDIYQTGSGTSTNMNVNEVIAARAGQLLPEQRIHPNDHVNRGQSSNDTFPAALHLATALQLRERLLPALEQLTDSLTAKSDQFKDVIKIGRTHLQDATPVTLGQEFGGYATQLRRTAARLTAAAEGLYELPLGGTATGTGLNSDAQLVQRVISGLAQTTGLPLREAEDHFEAQGARDGAVFFSAALRSLAVSLTKITNDIRWLASGPRTGLAEIRLPETQPGSSIMPGKVNPVQAESLLMVCARVFGNDLSAGLAGQSGNFELNVMMPLLADNLLESINLLSNGMTVFAERCVDGISADRERCLELTGRSLALVTALVPEIGYDRASALALQAYRENRPLRELLEAEQQWSAAELDRLLDPAAMLGSGRAPDEKNRENKDKQDV